MLPKFSHGLLWQDFQHSQLLDCIDTLNQAREKSREAQEFERALDFLEFYIDSHFALESVYMASLKYPKKRMHELLHNDFVRMVALFRRRARVTNEPEALVAELCDWLKSHILGVDKELAEFIKANQEAVK